MIATGWYVFLCKEMVYYTFTFSKTETWNILWNIPSIIIPTHTTMVTILTPFLPVGAYHSHHLRQWMGVSALQSPEELLAHSSVTSRAQWLFSSSLTTIWASRSFLGWKPQMCMYGYMCVARDVYTCDYTCMCVNACECECICVCNYVCMQCTYVGVSTSNTLRSAES